MIYTSVGAAAVTNEKLKELLEDLIQNSQFTEDEGKRIVDAFFYDIRQQIDKANGNIQMRMDELLQKMGIPSIQNLKSDLESYIHDVKEDPTLLLRHPARK